ncbi:MAG: hypothetical protein Q7V02_01700 [Methylophilus sp.]|nr:hypothetical protein [Methylophilus sp.]
MFKRFIYVIASVTSLLCLCKPTWAEDNSNFLDSFALGGYSSAGVEIPRTGTANAFVNEVSLILTWENDSRFKFFGEFELEEPLKWNSNQGLTTRDAYFDLERFYFDYNLSEKLNLRAGRFLTPAGRWNLIHAAPLVWTSTRPITTRLLFPSSVNGLMLYGSVPYKDYAFEYTFFAEGLKDQIRDDNEIIYKHVNGARFALNAPINIGMTLASLQEDKPLSATYRMLGLDFVTHLGNWELSGEGFYRITNKGNDGGSGAYLQSAYHMGNEWYWLTRVETFNHPNSGSAERWLVGATKRLKPNQLLKFEFVGGSGELPESPRGFISTFAVLF